MQLATPDIDPWRAGNSGIPGVTSFAADAPGPHVALIAVMHGNELAGAIVLDRLLRAGLRPARGRISFVFANMAAFDGFDPRQPTLSRFVDEDLNRLWDPEILDGPGQSCELDRARALRPLINSVDVVCDLHSMLWNSDPLILSGNSPRGRALGLAIGVPSLVVADRGHAGGPRLIDYPRFRDPGGTATAVLVEAGQHWEPATVATAAASVAGLLRAQDMLTGARAGCSLPPPSAPSSARVAKVTMAVTAATAAFAFVHPWRSGTVIPRRNTLLAYDGPTEIRTPHDNCLVVLPNLRPSRGHIAVRLARFV